jgi:hypothetical protein
MINVYVTHHVTASLDWINDLLVDQLYRMKEQLDAEMYKLHVVYWTDDARYEKDLVHRVPPSVTLLFNDRPNRPDSQPSKRNKVVEHARASGCEAFVLLHNDVRLARGALNHLVEDWRAAERKFGTANAIVSPRYMFFHLTTPYPEAVSKPEIWDRLRGTVKSAEEMEVLCKDWDATFKGGEVVCPKASRTTDDGHILMMFIADPRFFDDVGLCDESMTGFNYDDSDWGMRVLMHGKRNLQSTGALIGHISFLSFGPLMQSAEWLTRTADNAKLFIDKWGRAIFDEMQTGQLWIRLHREQRS